MSNNEIKTHIDFIDGQLNQYFQAYNNFRHGRNVGIRNKGERSVDNILLIITNYLNRYNDLHQVFIEHFQGYAYDEALSWQYFHRDMPGFLDKLRGMINP